MHAPFGMRWTYSYACLPSRPHIPTTTRVAHCHADVSAADRGCWTRAGSSSGSQLAPSSSDVAFVRLGPGTLFLEQVRKKKAIFRCSLGEIGATEAW